MQIEAPQWDEWESRFTALAESAETVPINGSIKGAQHYLCFLGENGLTPEEEMAELETLEKLQTHLKKVEVDTGYWQDTVLFVP